MSNWSPKQLGLLTDLYQLTMAYGYWKTKTYNRQAIFQLYYRKAPFNGSFAISCGLVAVIDYIKNLRFSVNEIQYLAALKGNDGQALFDESFLNHLQRLEFSCDIDAVPEGELVFPNQPIIRVKGPLLQAQLIETALLNLISFPSLIATKAARIVNAAQDDPVLEFGLRRAQGIDGGLTASRSAFVGGCSATSNVLAGKLYGIPVKGTHAHSWILSHDNERIAFEQYAKVMPNNCILLVDTYDTIQGVRHAITVAQSLQERGYKLNGIRLDSGDLCELSKTARSLLDQAGLNDVDIIASNDLDEYKIASLKSAGAQINAWGVGTQLSTAYEQASLGAVYKLTAIQNDAGTWEAKIKLSENPIKVSIPGYLQVRRFFKGEQAVGDMIYNEHLQESTQEIIYNDEVHRFEDLSYKELLVSIFQKGKCVYQSPSLKEIQAHCKKQLKLFPKNIEKDYPVGLEKNLHVFRQNLMTSLRQNKDLQKI